MHNHFLRNRYVVEHFHCYHIRTGHRISIGLFRKYSTKIFCVNMILAIYAIVSIILAFLVFLNPIFKSEYPVYRKAIPRKACASKTQPFRGIFFISIRFFAPDAVSFYTAGPGLHSEQPAPSRRHRRRWQPTCWRRRTRQARGSQTSRPARTRCSAGQCRCTCGRS